MQLRVDASAEEVRAALLEALSAEEVDQVSVDEKERDPFDVDERGEVLTFTTVVTWIALSAVGGVIGNATYDGLKRVASILVAKFGKDRVHEEDDVPAEDGTAGA